MPIDRFKGRHQSCWSLRFLNLLTVINDIPKEHLLAQCCNTEMKSNFFFSGQDFEKETFVIHPLIH